MLRQNSTLTNLLTHFEETPISAASLGQVHRAQLVSGQTVAIKIQYPNIAETLRGDMDLFRSSARLVANPLLRATVSELAEKLIQETDYLIERKHLDAFQTFERPLGLLIPRSLPEVCNERILTMSWVEGVPLSHNLDHPQRHRALQMLFEYFFSTLTQYGAVHGDPHPGNILIADATVGLVDFGSVKRELAPEVVELFLGLHSPLISNARLVELYEHLGAKISPSFEKDFVVSYRKLARQIFNQKQLEFFPQASLVRALRDNLMKSSIRSEMQGLSTEFTLLHKALQTLLSVGIKCRATLDTWVQL